MLRLLLFLVVGRTIQPQGCKQDIMEDFAPKFYGIGSFYQINSMNTR
jgi:hypothetical protein